MFINHAPADMPTPPSAPATPPFVVPGYIHIILDLLLFAFILVYSFIGYKKPHGNMLRYVYFGFSVYLLAFACMDFMMKRTNYIANSMVAFSALLIAYISGRLDKMTKNKIILVLVGILLLVADIYTFAADPNHGFDIITMIGMSSGLIAHAAIGFAYVSRYEEHKTGDNLDDKSE